jgi:TolB-like protein/Tfp pilus assembly protein PilF
MLAVLPFQNLTGDASQDYLSDGLTDELISQLGSIDPQGLGVIARTSVMRYRNSHAGLDKIGRELGVQYVLEGTLRRDEGRVRVSAQLIQLSDQTHMWARQYDRELVSLLTLQTEIALAVSDEIQRTLGGRTSRRPSRPVPPPVSDEAYELYLRGQYFWNMRTTQGLRQAIDYCGRAIARDPDFARAHAGLASSYVLLGGYSGEPQIEFMAKARAAALRALELDPKLAEAHAALALIVQNFDWDWQGAEKKYLRAIELNPNYATAHHWYAEHLTLRGRFDEALAEAARAQQLDPFSLIIAADKAVIFYYSRQYERAIANLNAVLAMDPGLARAHMVRYAYVETGRFEEALADIESFRAVESRPWHWSSLAYVYGRAGRRRESEHALAQLLDGKQATDPGTISWAYLGLGRKEEALVWLERAYAQHSNVLATLGVEPGYDPLRGDPRFQDLMRRVGLAE